MTMPNLVYAAPFRSAAAALILTIIFGPIGLLYSSLIGGLVMCAFALAGLGSIVAVQSPLPMATVWLACIVWAMISVRLYNYRLLKKLMAADGCYAKATDKCCSNNTCENKFAENKSDQAKFDRKQSRCKKKQKKKPHDHDKAEVQNNEDSVEASQAQEETIILTPKKQPKDSSENKPENKLEDGSEPKPQWKL